MKSAKTLSTIFISLLILAACKKEKTESPSITGFWEGKYSTGPTAYPTYDYAFLFRDNGTVRVFDNKDTALANKAEGTYSITGSALTAHYTYITSLLEYSFAAEVNTKFTFMEGSWGNGNNTINGGKFFVSKK